jgi:hypothetical protein
MVIETINTEVIIRLPLGIDTQNLENLINYLIYKEATAASVATQTQADALAHIAKKGWWAKNKNNIMQ